MAERHCNLERLAVGGVLFPLNAPVLARRNIKSQLVLVVDHDPISAVIDPALVGIARNIDAASAYITTAVFVVPKWRRKFKHVDIAVLVDVIEQRAFLNKLCRYWLDAFVVVFPDFDEIHLGLARGQP